MEITDLMMGDWVKIIHHHMPKPLIKVKKVDLKDFRDALLQVYPEITYEPYPITLEILEKNGFKEDFESNGIYWRPDCRKFCIVKELGTWYFAFRLVGEIFEKSAGYICISECNYVHKLQHKLKDLEINKEIVL